MDESSADRINHLFDGLDGIRESASNHELPLTRYSEKWFGEELRLSCKLVKGYNGGANQKAAAASAQGSTVSVYPNPAKDAFYAAPLSSELVLLDMSGKTLIKRTSTAVETSLDLSSFAHGMYMLHVQTPGTSFSQRVVKR